MLKKLQNPVVAKTVVTSICKEGHKVSKKASYLAISMLALSGVCLTAESTMAADWRTISDCVFTDGTYPNCDTQLAELTSGAKGDKGDIGLTGSQGEQGIQGLTGATGDTGAKGDKGDKGDIGLTGAKGEQGIQGLTGAKGDTGAKGLQGEIGAKGETGAKGDKGDIGLTGAQGEQGIQGLTGAKGEAGKDANINVAIQTSNSTATPAQATGKDSIAIGNGAVAEGSQSISIGVGNLVTGKNSGAIGDPSTVSGSGSYSFGNNNTVTGNNTVVLGNGISTGVNNSVVLGSDSTANRDNTVSVGSVGSERQIINVAAGTQGSDAVNVTQLNTARLKAVTDANTYTDTKYDVLNNSFQNYSNGINRRVDDVEKTANNGVAISLATQQAIPNLQPGKVAVFGGVGHYEGESALAIGAATMLDNGRTSVSGAFGFADSKFGGRVGMSYIFGQ